MIETICALIFAGATTVLPTECAADPGHIDNIIPIITPPKPKPVADPRRHSRPSPRSMNMVTIRAGELLIGSPDSEPKRQRFEGPQVLVKIPYRFEIGKFEVTYNDWNKCLRGGGCRGYRPDDKGWGKGRRPVINISYNDAQSYIRWLNRKTGLRYRLPTEAEWEYVAKAGQLQPLSTGAAIHSGQANFDGKAPYGTVQTGPYHRKTMPVGQYASNAFGVFDIHGNVYEWVQDCWNENHVGRPEKGVARTDGDCNYRVMKGGSWVTHGYQTRAAARIRYVKDYRYDDYGFRLARTLK